MAEVVCMVEVGETNMSGADILVRYKAAYRDTSDQQAVLLS
jgi:hypothetical protein